MDYRLIGNTGLRAGVVGLGAEHLDGQPYNIVESTIHAALDNGVNIIDAFMPGEEIRRHIGRALHGRRDKVLLQGHICSVDLNEKYDISRDLDTAKRYFENLLRFLNTDYIDFGMLFFMDSHADVDAVIQNGIADYLLEQKQKGVVRHIGASSHNPKVAKRLIELGMIDLLMFSINAAYDLASADKPLFEAEEFDFESGLNPERMELYKLAEKGSVGITVMKTLCAGKLISAEHTPFKAPMSVGQCIHYALTRPAVSSVLVGCASPAEVEEAMRYFTLTDEEKDYSLIVSESRSSMKGSCVYCSHCQPCPASIDIAMVNKYLDVALLDTANIPPSIRHHYSSLENRGSACVACGSCENRCPFDVKVIKNMQKAAELFGD